MKFRKIPTVIDAVQFDGDNWPEMDAFTPGFRATGRAEYTAEVYDELHDTWVGVSPGQWVIRGIKGEFYPIADDVFAATYEAVAS